MLEEYRLKRLMKRIKLKDVAEYVGCSSSTISRLENEKGYQIKPDKVEKYKYFIDNYEEIKEKQRGR